MRQTIALLLDSYRELNAKKLFWISLVLSGLIVVVIGAIGFDRDGISIFGWAPDIVQDPSLKQMPEEMLNEMRGNLYKGVFNFLGVQIWLTWAAVILAIFSTAGLFPGLMTSGAIDTLLTKPISRIRLFLTKYFLGLGFVGMQVALFSICSFVVIGLRAGLWEPKLFLAIPIVLLFFSYLYAVLVLVGVWTRSTLLAVILTGLVWVLMIGLNFTDNLLLAQQAQLLVEVDIAESRIEYMQTLPTYEQYQAQLNAQHDGPALEDAADPEAYFSEDYYDQIETREGYEATFGTAVELQRMADSNRESANGFGEWRGYMFWIKTPLPKTSETADLMSRVLIDQEDLEEVAFNPGQPADANFHYGPGAVYPQLVQQKTMQLQRSWAWVLLTSILFEAVVVGLAAWKFCRRDY